MSGENRTLVQAHIRIAKLMSHILLDIIEEILRHEQMYQRILFFFFFGQKNQQWKLFFRG